MKIATTQYNHHNDNTIITCPISCSSSSSINLLYLISILLFITNAVVVVVHGYGILPSSQYQSTKFRTNNINIKNSIQSTTTTTFSSNFLHHNFGTQSQKVSFLYSSRQTFVDGDEEDDEEDDDDNIEEVDMINGNNELVSVSNSENEMYISELEVASRANDIIQSNLEDDSSIITTTNNKSIDLQTEISNSFLQYALSIIMGRAIPDIRDGLKPVHRRILYAMDQLKLYNGMSHRKCARVVGEVLGKYHPHGDIAVYDSLVRMAQDFSSNHPIIDGHGNFGSIDADPAAAMRYTECRLTLLAQHTLLCDDYDSTINNDSSTGSTIYPIVDFIPNFDGNEVEPTVLPAKIPFLLLNGASGIAVGMATNIPPHNLNELMNACISMISHRKEHTIISDDELFTIIPGPDFPTAASILGTSNSYKLYSTGQGGIIMRAITHIENYSGTKRNNNAASTSTSTSTTTSNGRNSIIVTQLPYQVNKASLLQKIALLVNEKRLEGISDLRDESDRDGIRIVIELKRDAVASIVEKNLFLKTSLQTTFAGNFLALLSKDDDTTTNTTEDTNNNTGPTILAPQRFTLKKALDCFLSFRFQTIRKRTRYQLLKVMNRIHIVDGLLTAISNIDTVIDIIRTSPDQNTARSTLQNKLSTTIEQTDAILKLQLGQLTRLNSGRLDLEKTELQTREKELNGLLDIDDTVYDYMVDEFIDIKKRFGRDRRTIIIPDNEMNDSITDMDLIRNSRSVIVVTHGGYIKRLPLKTFENQKRGTRGKLGTTSTSGSSSISNDDRSIVSTKLTTTTTTTTTTAHRDEEIAHCFSCNDHDTLLMVTQNGIAYGIRAYQVPIAGRTARGQPIPSVLSSVSVSDVITTILPVSEFAKNDYLLLTTEYGWIKKTSLDTFERMTSRGLVVAKLDNGDRLRYCQQIRDGDDILIGTANGLAIRFEATSLRSTSRTSRGVRAINLKDNDTIADVNVVSAYHKQEDSSSSTGSTKKYSKNNNNSNEEEFALIVTAKGYGKRVPMSKFKTQARGGVGAIATKFKSTSHDRVSCLLVVKDSDEILVITAKGIMLRQKVHDISSQGRSATGVTIQKLDDGDEIVNVSIVPTYEESD